MKKPIQPKLVRVESKRRIELLGWQIPDSLPLLDDEHVVRNAKEVSDRSLALSTIVAVAHGADRSRVEDWLQSEQLSSSLTELERSFLGSSRPTRASISVFRGQEEALWVLAWSLGKVPEIDLAMYCDERLAQQFPKFLKGETSERFRQSEKFRPAEEIFALADQAYCLHWCVRQSQIGGQPNPINIEEYVILERRRALEWLLGEDDWDDPSLDT